MGCTGCARRAAAIDLSHGPARGHYLPASTCRIYRGSARPVATDDPLSIRAERRPWGRVHAEAMHQFLAQGIHLTEHRTGVLIFASVAERYAEIVADSGINAKVTPDVWSKAV